MMPMRAPIFVILFKYWFILCQIWLQRLYVDDESENTCRGDGCRWWQNCRGGIGACFSIVGFIIGIIFFRLWIACGLRRELIIFGYL